MLLKQITFRNLENVLMNYPDACIYKIYKYWLFLAVPSMDEATPVDKTPTYNHVDQRTPWPYSRYVFDEHPYFFNEILSGGPVRSQCIITHCPYMFSTRHLFDDSLLDYLPDSWHDFIFIDGLDDWSVNMGYQQLCCQATSFAALAKVSLMNSAVTTRITAKTTKVR